MSEKRQNIGGAASERVLENKKVRYGAILVLGLILGIVIGATLEGALTGLVDRCDYNPC